MAGLEREGERRDEEMGDTGDQNWRKWTHMGTDSAEAGRERIKVC